MPTSETENAMPVVVILTAIPVEYQAVKAYLDDIKEDKAEDGTIYEKGVFRSDGQDWHVLIRDIGAGNTRAASEVNLAYERYRPEVMLFCGIAGGIKDVSIGDVVVANKIYSCESGKGEKEFRARPELYSPSYAALERAKAEAKETRWLMRLDKKARLVPKKPPRHHKVHIKPIASTAQVVASSDADMINRIKEHYNDAIAVEMEGFGFLQSCYQHPEMYSLVVRGISDLVDNKAETDRRRCQEMAATSAAAFTFQVLSSLGLHRHHKNSDRTEVRAPEKRNQTTKEQNARIARSSKPRDEMPELTKGFRADTVLYRRLAGAGLRCHLDALRSGVLNTVLRRAGRPRERDRAHHLFDLGLLTALQKQSLKAEERRSLLLSAIDLIQDVSDENPSYIRHRALLVASDLALKVPGFPWLDQCPRVQKWLRENAWDGLNLGDHWLIALTVLAGDKCSADKVAAKYDTFVCTPDVAIGEREHATLNLAEGLRSVLVSARRQLPSVARVLKVLRWVDLGYVKEEAKLGGAGQIRLLLICGDLINIVKMCNLRPEYAKVVELVEGRIETAMQAITRKRIKRVAKLLENFKTSTSTPPWHLEPTYLSDDNFWLREDKTGLRETLLDFYEVVVKERDEGEYTGKGWESWLPYFKDLGRTSENKRLQWISKAALEKGPGATSR